MTKACSDNALSAVGEEDCVMEEAAIVEEGPMTKQACSNNNRKAEAALLSAVGEEDCVMEEDGPLMKACSNSKRKTKAGLSACSKRRKGGPYKGSTTETESKSAGGEVAADASGGYLARAENGMWILPDTHVQYMLNLEIDRMPPSDRDDLLEEQAWIRRQYDANRGIVLVDAEKAADWADKQRLVEEIIAEVLKESDTSGNIPLWESSDEDDFVVDSDDDEDDFVVDSDDDEDVVQPVRAKTK